jgi:UDP-glucose 4-epimerase
VFEAAAAADVPVVYASSAAVYGEPAELPIDEDSQMRPLTAYGADKLGGEIHARIGGTVRGLRTFGLRFFNVFGPNQDPSSPYSGVIAIFVDRINRGLPIIINGDGNQTRDFIYVSDVVQFLAAALPLASTSAPICNVCRGEPVTIVGLAEAVMNACARRVEIRQGVARMGDIRHSVGSTTRARALFQFNPQIGLIEGLRQLVAPDATQVIV